MRLILSGTLAGAIIAWFLAGVIYYVPAQEAAVRRGKVRDFDIGPILAIGLLGALAGATIARRCSQRPLPPWVQGAAIGCLVGVTVVVVGSLALAWGLGGPSAMHQAPYLDRGRIAGVPLGGLTGGVVGAIIAVWRRRPASAPDGSKRCT